MYHPHGGVGGSKPAHPVARGESHCRDTLSFKAWRNKLPEITATTPIEKTEPKTSPAATPEPVQHEEAETALESLASICTVLAVGLFVMTFVFQNFEIPSASMEKTLLIGDHVLVDRISLAPPAHWAPFVRHRDPLRGDVIVFLKPHPETPDLYLVKRCIGIPGDHIHLRDGVVYLNGAPQNEPYAQQPRDDGNAQHALSPYRDDFPSVPVDPNDSNVTANWAIELPNHIENGDLVVPQGSVFAMGDNRTESLDGRFWGFVPRENIVGRPMFVYWSFETPADQIEKTGLGDRIAFMGHVLIHIFDETRWHRTLHIVR
jgi:signal peptidase I